MKAYIQYSHVMRAAAWLAGQNFDGEIQVTRHGDKAIIFGTDCYVALIADVDATFEDWPDGEKVAVGGGPVARMVRKVCKHPFSISVEDWEGSRVAQLDSSTAGRISKRCRCDVVEKPKKLNLSEIGGDPSKVIVGEGILWRIGKLVGMLENFDTGGWTIKTHGELRAFELVQTKKPYRIVAMPRRGA